jgi:hypothetical protein
MAQGFEMNEFIVIDRDFQNEKLLFSRYDNVLGSHLESRSISIEPIVYDGAGIQAEYESQSLYFIGCLRGENSIDGGEGFEESCRIQSLYRYNWITDKLSKEVDLVESSAEADRINNWIVADENTLFIEIRNVLYKIDLGSGESKELFDANVFNSSRVFTLNKHVQNKGYIISLLLISENELKYSNEDTYTHQIIVYNSRFDELEIHSVGAFKSGVHVKNYTDNCFLFEELTYAPERKNGTITKIISVCNNGLGYIEAEMENNYIEPYLVDGDIIILTDGDKMKKFDAAMNEITTNSTMVEPYILYCDSKICLVRDRGENKIHVLNENLELMNEFNLVNLESIFQVIRIQ